jgi:3-oxoadipate enol-lactonase
MKLEKTVRGVHVEIDGAESGAWITFLNSISTDLRIWDGVLPTLTSKFRILRIDAPGHGRSPAPEAAALPLRQHADLIAGVWDELQIQKSHVVGISLGGKLALALGAWYPNRVASIVACACREPADPSIAAAWQKRIDQVLSHGMAEEAEKCPVAWLPAAYRESHPDAVPFLRQMILGTNARGFAACAAALQEQQALPLEHVSVPALLVGGSEDRVVTANLESIRQRLPTASIQVIPGAAHLFVVDSAAAFAQLLHPHLSST